MAAMQMRDDRHRATIRLRIVSRHVASRETTRWISPVDGLVDRQEMRQEPATTIDQLIHPGGADLSMRSGFNRISRIVKGVESIGGAVTPVVEGKPKGR